MQLLLLPRELHFHIELYYICSCEPWPKENSPAGIYLFKVNNKNTKTRCEICSKSTIKTPNSD